MIALQNFVILAVLAKRSTFIIILIFDSFVALGFCKNSFLDKVYVLQIFYCFYTEDFDMQ